MESDSERTASSCQSWKHHHSGEGVQVLGASGASDQMQARGSYPGKRADKTRRGQGREGQQRSRRPGLGLWLPAGREFAGDLDKCQLDTSSVMRCPCWLALGVKGGRLQKARVATQERRGSNGSCE